MQKKILIACAFVLLLLATYAGLGIYALPRWAKTNLPALVAEKTGAALQMQSMRLDPFAFKAELQGVSLAAAEGEPLLDFDQLALDIDVVASIRQKTLVVDYVKLLQPKIHIERRTGQRFNFSDIQDKLASEPGQAEQQTGNDENLPLAIGEVVLVGGEIDWRDLTIGEQGNETLRALDVTLTGFSTVPNSTAQLQLGFNLASGGQLEWQGEADLNALRSKGRIKLTDLYLPKVWQLVLQSLSPLKIEKGALSFDLNYDVGLEAESGLALLISDSGLQIDGLTLAEKDKPDKPLIGLAELSASGIKLDLQKQSLDISAVTSRGGRIDAWLDADGRVNYQSLFAAAAAESDAVATNATEGETPWLIQLGKLELNSYSLDFTDNSQAQPVAFRLSDLNLEVENYRNEDGIRLPLKLDTRINDSGSLSLSGNMVAAPFSADFSLALKNIKLKRFQSYLDPYLKLELVDGSVNTEGELKLAMAEQLQLTYVGDANIDNLVTRDRIKNQDFLKWANLDVKAIRLDLDKQDYLLGKVTFDQPYFRFTIKNDGSNNVSDLLVAEKRESDSVKAKSETGAASAKAPEPVVTIGEILMKDGQSDFADYSLILPFVVKMKQLNGEVDGFVSNTDKAIKLKLDGRVHDLATAKIKGNYQLQSGDSEISLNFKHLPLPLITPYMAEFAGYKIEKGQLALDLSYSVKKGQLSAENKVFIDQLVLGEKVENPNAVSLPLEFGIALLKDADGKINLNFPISGSLEDPKFSVGSLVADVLVNLVTKAVTSPFKALGSLFDSDEDYSVVTFAAGSSDLTAEEAAKLDQIANALAAKPKLVLEIKGVSYETEDWPVIRSDALLDVLKKMKSGELRDKGETVRSEYIELSDDDYKRQLAKFYAEVFPQRIDRTLFGRPIIKGNPDADFYQQARNELEAVMKPEAERMNELAVNRANRIAQYLTDTAGVDRSRIYVLATDLKQDDGGDGIRALLSLNVAS